MNKDTAFGKYYKFEDITSIEDYKNAVPLYDHRAYNKLIRLHTEVGESNLITVKKIRAYAYDFNESSEMRTVPVTVEASDEFGKKFINNIVGETTFLMTESMPKGMQLNDGTYYDSIDGIVVRSGIDSFSLSYSGLDDALTAPFSLVFPTEAVNSAYLNLLMAMRNEDVTQIYGSTTWIVLNYIEMILKNGESICADIEKGTVSVPYKENEILYREVLSRNTPNPERARLIREALQSEDKGQLLQKIWPKLKRVIARSGANCNIYTKKVGKYLGEVSLELEDFITPFGNIAAKTEENNVFKLNNESGFYEFLPVGENDSADTKLLTEVEAGKVYELILSNDGGIYRMHTSTFVRPIRVTKEGLWFEECMRPLLGNGQKLCDGDAFEVLLEDCIGDALYDYFCFFDEDENRLELLIELDGDKKERNYSDEIEQRLMQEKEYSDARQKGMKACRVRYIEKETRLLWRDLRSAKFGAPAECFHPVHNIEKLKRKYILKELQIED